MRRRALLASLCGVGLAGCSSRGGTPSGRTTPTDTWTFWPTTVDDTPAPGVDLAVEADPVDAPDFEWAAEVLSAPTTDRPGRLLVALENTGQARTLTTAGELPFPITPGTSTDGDARIRPALAPVGADYEPRFEGTCWRAPLDDPNLADDAPWDWGYGNPQSRTLAAGERIEGIYHLLSSIRWSCFEPGDYRFERRYELDGREYAWAFTLQVRPAGGDA